MEEANLSEAFWNVRLVQDLGTSVINSPFFNVFLAAQVHCNDNSFMMNGTKVRDLIITIGDIHHIFPKKYLQNNGITEKSKYNQIANYTFLDSQTNISIGEKSPKEYFTILFEQCKTKKLKYGNITDIELLKENLNANCIPENITEMDMTDYEFFLTERRKLMAKKIKDYYYSL
jgi:hypothetical protein